MPTYVPTQVVRADGSRVAHEKLPSQAGGRAEATTAQEISAVARHCPSLRSAAPVGQQSAHRRAAAAPRSPSAILISTGQPNIRVTVHCCTGGDMDERMSSGSGEAT